MLHTTRGLYLPLEKRHSGAINSVASSPEYCLAAFKSTIGGGYRSKCAERLWGGCFDREHRVSLA